mgnify:CR=1 FL=1
MAKHSLKQLDEALKDYEKGIELDPANEQLKKGLADLPKKRNYPKAGKKSGSLAPIA